MLEFGFKSDKGKVRAINQDSFFVMPEENLFLVADGVGGHSFGEMASRMAMTDIASFIKDNPILPDAEYDGIKDYFVKLTLMVNRHIHDAASGSEHRGMATTLIMLYVKNDYAYVVNVGDSRAYLIRDKEISRMTEDHTFVNDLVKKGIITENQAQNHPDRNMITRAIGADETVKPDFFSFELYAGDVILLCTDGLYNEVDEESMCETVLMKDNMRGVCAKLVDDANANGGSDNITVVGVKI